MAASAAARPARVASSTAPARAPVRQQHGHARGAGPSAGGTTTARGVGSGAVAAYKARHGAAAAAVVVQRAIAVPTACPASPLPRQPRRRRRRRGDGSWLLGRQEWCPTAGPAAIHSSFSPWGDWPGGEGGGGSGGGKQAPSAPPSPQPPLPNAPALAARSAGRCGLCRLPQPPLTARLPPISRGRNPRQPESSRTLLFPVAGFPRLSVRRGLSLARTRPSYSTRHVQLHRLSTRRFPTFREETRCASVPTAADSLRGRPLAVVARAHQHSGWSACQRRC